MPDELLTVQEVAGYLKINPQTVHNWITRREIPAVRVGKRRVRIRQADLDAFIAAGSQPAIPPDRHEPVRDVTDSTDAVDSPPVEAVDGLKGKDRSEIVRALDALSEAAQTLADQLRPADAGESDSSPLEGHELPAIPVTASPTPRRRRA